MAASSDWLIKILSGPHQGAEALLRPGRFTVGSDPACDLVLHDVLIAPKHLSFSLEKGQLKVEPGEGSVFYQGKKSDLPTTVAAFSFITAGTTHLVVGPADARWPLLSAADAPDLEKISAPSEPEKTSPQAGTVEKTSPHSDPTKPATPTPEQRRRAAWMAGFGGLLLLVWFVLWMIYTPPQAPASVAPTPVARLEAVLARFPGLGLETRSDERSGLLLVSGYLEEDSVHRDLTQALRAEVPEATLRLWSRPRILETAQTFAAQRNLPIVLRSGEQGTLIAQGTAVPPEVWRPFSQMLLSEVPGLTDVRTDWSTTAAPRPTRETDPGFPPRPIAPTIPPAKTTDLRVTAHVFNPNGQSWIRLSDGSLHFRGSRLRADLALVEISAEGAVFESGGNRTTIARGQALPLSP